MAGLGNTGINGFLSSAKLTGQKIIKRGKEIPEMVEHFLSGFAGYGWKIWEHRKGKYKLEIDDLNVRGTMTVYELLIQKIRAVIGALAITQGQGKIKSVSLSPDQSEYLIQIEEDMSFREYDFIRCQTWTGNVKMYHVKIDRISDNTIIHIPIEEFDTDYDEFGQLVVHNAPAIGDDIIQFGNEVYEDRQSAIYLHADESGQPAIDIMFGINSKDWTNCVKGRLGGDIPGADGLKGFFVENGMIKGVDSTGHTTYCIYPDGTAEFGDGSTIFRPDRSGHLAGGAINWYWDDNLGKYKCVMDDVVLTWDNLDTGVKDSIKPKIGSNGNWWVKDVDTGVKAEGKDGIDGIDGKDGEDANLLPWIEEWDSNKTMIGTEQVVSPKMFSGTRDANGKLTGVALGRDCITIDGVKHTGIFALDEDELMVELDPINKKYKFKGEVQATSGILDNVTIDGLLKVSSGYEGDIGNYNLFWIAPVSAKNLTVPTTFDSKGKTIKFYNASSTVSHTLNLLVVGYLFDSKGEVVLTDYTILDEAKGARIDSVFIPPKGCVEVSCFEIPPGSYFSTGSGSSRFYDRVLSWEMTNRETYIAP